MKLYVTYTSPYARLARIVVIEKTLEDRVEIIEAKDAHRGKPLLQDQPLRACTLSHRRCWRWHGRQPTHLCLSRQPRRQASLPPGQHLTQTGLICGSSFRRAVCATAFLYGREKWLDQRTSVPRLSLPMK